MSILSVAPGPDPGGPTGEAAAWFGLGLISTAALALLAMRLAGHGTAFPLVAVASFALIAAVCLPVVARNHPHPRFGGANVATTARAVVVSLFAGLAADPLRLQAVPAMAWGWLCLAVFALALDGLDGWLARRHGTGSAFGARYDMEIDALLILLLSWAAVLAGKAGPWIVAIGALRYAFLAAGLVLPALRGPLPPSFRRKLVCVVQGVALCLGLAPVTGRTAAAAIGAAALAALAWSFAVDVARLIRAGRAGRLHA